MSVCLLFCSFWYYLRLFLFNATSTSYFLLRWRTLQIHPYSFTTWMCTTKLFFRIKKKSSADLLETIKKKFKLFIHRKYFTYNNVENTTRMWYFQSRVGLLLLYISVLYSLLLGLKSILLLLCIFRHNIIQRHAFTHVFVKDGKGFTLYTTHS